MRLFMKKNAGSKFVQVGLLLVSLVGFASLSMSGCGEAGFGGSSNSNNDPNSNGSNDPNNPNNPNNTNIPNSSPTPTNPVVTIDPAKVPPGGPRACAEIPGSGTPTDKTSGLVGNLYVLPKDKHYISKSQCDSNPDRILQYNFNGNSVSLGNPCEFPWFAESNLYPAVLRASKYLNPNYKVKTSVGGTIKDLEIYFGQLGIYPQTYKADVKTSDGTLIVKGSDAVHFGLQLTATLQRLPGEVAGKLFQFALVADDGAVLYDSAGMEIVNGDGHHGPFMACASTGRQIPDSGLGIRIDYNQGPGEQLALTLLEREVGNIHDGICYNFDTPVINGKLYAAGTGRLSEGNFPATLAGELTNNGWRVVPASRFKLPAGKENPCVQ